MIRFKLMESLGLMGGAVFLRPTSLTWWWGQLKTRWCRWRHREHWVANLPGFGMHRDSFHVFRHSECRQCSCAHEIASPTRSHCLVCAELAIPGEGFCSTHGTDKLKLGNLESVTHWTLANQLTWRRRGGSPLAREGEQPVNIYRAEHHVADFEIRHLANNQLELRIAKAPDRLWIKYVQPSRDFGALYEAVLRQRGIFQRLVSLTSMKRIEADHPEYQRVMASQPDE